MEKLIKSKKRVKKYAEVFTPLWLVKDMVDMLEKEGNTIGIADTVLEPTCGEGIFLIEILERKLKLAKEGYNFRRDSLTALASLYGVEIQLDNVKICKKKLYDTWAAQQEYINVEMERAAKEILERNIIHGDFLKAKTLSGAQIWFLPKQENSNAKTNKKKKVSNKV